MQSSVNPDTFYDVVWTSIFSFEELCMIKHNNIIAFECLHTYYCCQIGSLRWHWSMFRDRSNNFRCWQSTSEFSPFEGCWKIPKDIDLQPLWISRHPYLSRACKLARCLNSKVTHLRRWRATTLFWSRVSKNFSRKTDLQKMSGRILVFHHRSFHRMTRLISHPVVYNMWWLLHDC